MKMIPVDLHMLTTLFYKVKFVKVIVKDVLEMIVSMFKTIILVKD